MVMEIAWELYRIGRDLNLPVIFKASYEKDNRSTVEGYRGPGLKTGLFLLEKVRSRTALPILSDVHRESDVPLAAEILDVVQVPAFLCQQTSLLEAVGRHASVVNLKKGPFLAPENMAGPVGKVRRGGCDRILLTERGSSFGYNRLVSDMTSVPLMQELGCPVVFDATHIGRRYGISSSDSRGGEPGFNRILARCGAAAGCDALFLETHPRPSEALCDGASMVPLGELRPLLEAVLPVADAVRRNHPVPRPVPEVARKNGGPAFVVSTGGARGADHRKSCTFTSSSSPAGRVDLAVLGGRSSIWELNADEIDFMYRRRHLNNYIHAALLTLLRSRWPREGRFHLASGMLRGEAEAKANAILEHIASLEASSDPRKTRLVITRLFFELYRDIGPDGWGDIPRIMDLFAALAFIALIAERADQIPLWFHPPVRDIHRRIIKEQFSMLMSEIDYDEYVLRFKDELERQKVDCAAPMSRLFVVPPRLVQSCIMMAENGMGDELIRVAHIHNEKAMIAFERKYKLGSLAAMPLNVSHPGQLRYRNTVYLYGGNHFERMGNDDEALAWYLKDVDDPALPANVGFYLTSLKTCERLLLGYRLLPSEDRSRLKALIHRTLEASLVNLSHYAQRMLSVIDEHPELDVTHPRFHMDGRMYLFGGEGLREPLLIALLYQNMINGIPYSEISYSVFEEA